LDLRIDVGGASSSGVVYWLAVLPTSVSNPPQPVKITDAELDYLLTYLSRIPYYWSRLFEQILLPRVFHLMKMLLSAQ
jgi:hypothetical protein